MPDTDVRAPSGSRSEAEAASEGQVPGQHVGAGFYVCGRMSHLVGVEYFLKPQSGKRENSLFRSRLRDFFLAYTKMQKSHVSSSMAVTE